MIPGLAEDICEHGTLTGESGALASPNYPADYDNNLDCGTRITANEGYTVLVSITDLEVEGCYDHLEVSISH